MEKEELIEKYFLDELDANQRSELFALMEKDPVLKEQFEFEQKVQRASKLNERAAVKDRLKTFESELEERPPARKVPWRRMGIAATIALLLGLGGYWYIFNREANFKELYAANYENYPNTVHPITRGDGNNSLERRAFVAYESGQYKEAISLFKELAGETGTHLGYVNFYLAQCYLQTEDLDAAILILEDEINIENRKFHYESIWYLALAHIWNENPEKARGYLNVLDIQEGYKTEEARLLLKKLP